MSADDRDRTPQRPDVAAKTDAAKRPRPADELYEWTLTQLQRTFPGSTWSGDAPDLGEGWAGYAVERDTEADHGVSALIVLWPIADDTDPAECCYMGEVVCCRGGKALAHVTGCSAATAALAGERLRMDCLAWLADTVAGDWQDELKDATSVLAGLCGVSLASLVAEAFNLQAQAPDAEVAAELGEHPPEWTSPAARLVVRDGRIMSAAQQVDEANKAVSDAFQALMRAGTVADRSAAIQRAKLRTLRAELKRVKGLAKLDAAVIRAKIREQGLRSAEYEDEGQVMVRDAEFSLAEAKRWLAEAEAEVTR